MIMVWYLGDAWQLFIIKDDEEGEERMGGDEERQREMCGI